VIVPVARTDRRAVRYWRLRRLQRPLRLSLGVIATIVAVLAAVITLPPIEASLL